MSVTPATISPHFPPPAAAKARPSNGSSPLPKLDFKYQAVLEPALDSLGMHSAFAHEHGAIFIEDVVHEAVIKVSEGGTIATAATAVLVTKSSAPMNQRRSHVAVCIHRRR